MDARYRRHYDGRGRGALQIGEDLLLSSLDGVELEEGERHLAVDEDRSVRQVGQEVSVSLGDDKLRGEEVVYECDRGAEDGVQEAVGQDLDVDLGGDEGVVDAVVAGGLGLLEGVLPGRDREGKADDRRDDDERQGEEDAERTDGDELHELFFVWLFF